MLDGVNCLEYRRNPLSCLRMLLRNFTVGAPMSSASMLLFLIDPGVYVAAPAAPRALAELRSGCLRRRGARRPPLQVPRPAAAAAATVRRALERARPAHRARAPAHVCPLLSPFRRLIRPLLVLAGAGDASELYRVSGHRLRPAAAAIDARGGADKPLSRRGACATERARESVAGGRAVRRACTCECY